MLEFLFKFHWNLISIGSGNGLVLNRRQAITWINANPVYWCVYAAPGRDEVTNVDSSPKHRFSQKWQLRMYKLIFRMCKMSLFMKISLRIKQLGHAISKTGGCTPKGLVTFFWEQFQRIAQVISPKNYTLKLATISSWPGINELVQSRFPAAPLLS